MRLRRYGAAYHIERAIAARMGFPEYLCACRQCRGARVRSVDTVARHHRQHGRDPFLPYPVLATDGSSIQRPSSPRDRSEENYIQRQNYREVPSFVWPQRTEVNVPELVHDAYVRADELHMEAERQEDLPPAQADTDNGSDVCMNDSDMEQLLRESTTSVYENCPINRLQAGIIMLNMCNLFGVPNTFLDELLMFLAGDLLPRSNCLPRNTYETKRMVMRMGLEHEAIHCCPNGHVLYQGVENGDLLQCPTCEQSRYIVGSNQIPRKVLRYFPLVPRLQRLYRCPEVARLMKWHASNHSHDGLMRSVVDSPQWALVGNIDPGFVMKDTNVYMGLVGDGVNPFGNQSIKHSSWPLLIVLYNLPPWLATRKFFISLTMVIPDEKALSPQAFDIFLRPLLNDLKRLWSGVPASNASMAEGSRQFILRGILLWTVNDFPAYGLIFGQQVKGYRGCPVCTSDTCSSHSGILKKMLYLGHRRFLSREHRFRRAKVAFNGEQEWREAPQRPLGAEILRRGEEREVYISSGGTADGEDDPLKTHGVKRVSVLFELPYWEKLPVRHLVDTMHTKKNVCENILKTLLGEKDKPATRADMQAKGIREHLWLKPVPNNPNKFCMPDAPYVLSSNDRSTFLQTLGSIKTPTGCTSNLANRIADGKIRGLKSHDYHVLMQQLLPVSLRGLGDAGVTSTVIRLCSLYRKLCAKVVDPGSKEEMMCDAAEVLSCMEKDFPPCFFDIMIHLTVHLVEELFICGPTQTRWMYPFERYFKGLKGFVRNLAKPEGSIAQGYQVEEALGFVTEYMAHYQPTSRRVWDENEDPTMTDEILQGKGKPRKLSEQLRMWMHNFVCENVVVLEEHRQNYKAFHSTKIAARERFRREHRRRRGRRQEAFPPELCEPPSFSLWLESEVQSQMVDDALPYPSEDIINLSKLPSLHATKYRSMWAFGNHVRVAGVELHLRTCDSGVAATFCRPCRSGLGDVSHVIADIEYVGHVEEIVELNYGGLCVVVLICSWLKANYRGNTATVKKDKWGFTMANFQRMIPLGPESFAFPMNIQQVFFSDSREEPGWKVVLRKEVRGRRVVENVGADEVGVLFQVGRDVDHATLQSLAIIPEQNPKVPRTGRRLRREDLLAEWIEEPNLVYDANVGDSGPSSEEE